VWWCPIGLLGYLPLHAAVLDRVVSSYAISARALADARNRPPSRSVTGRKPHGRTLVVSVPDAPGVPPLPSAIAEAKAIKEVIPDATVLSHPTRDRVLQELPDHALVHFSCHGEANMSDPASGRLVMPDYATAPLTVADIAAQRADGHLAFLSACETGRTSPALSNEAIHLTGAFHLSGFRNVIGSLWPVLDEAASAVTRDFYRAISGNGTLPPDATQSALALHHATRRLRAAYQKAPGIWAAFTHTGP
jgi:CHAT domain-containing protein